MLLGADGVRQSLIFSTIVAGSIAVLGAVRWHEFFLALFFSYSGVCELRHTASVQRDRRPWRESFRLSLVTDSQEG